jgi:hypothetical protein
LYPRVGFIVTNMTRPADRVVTFCNHRGTAEQSIKEAKNAVTSTRLTCRRFAANAVRLQRDALAYSLANFLRTVALPEAISHWSMTTLRDRLVKIGAKIVRHGRSITFQIAEVMVPRDLLQNILDAIAALRPLPAALCCPPPRLSRLACRRETCVRMPAYRPRILLAQRSTVSRQGSSRGPGNSAVAERPERKLDRLASAALTVHPGSLGSTHRRRQQGHARYEGCISQHARKICMCRRRNGCVAYEKIHPYGGIGTDIR